MKVCHVITRMILGGAQENTLLTCEGLHARGHEVTLVTGPALGPEGQLLTRARAGGYRVVELDLMRREVRPLRDWRCLRRLRRLLAELDVDVVHAHSSKAGILGRQAAWSLRRRGGRPKIVHTVHGLAFDEYQPWWRRGLYIRLERRAATQSDALISVADAMTAQALAAGVGRADQYTTVYSGIQVDAFLRRPAEADDFRRSLALPRGAVLVTQVSRLAPMKGHEFLLDAAQRLAASGRPAGGPPPAPVHFCLVGDGTLRLWIEAEVRRRGLVDRFHLTGLLPPERMPAVFHAADLVVHASLREGLARAIPQAMLAGRPVVSFDIGGAHEVVDSATGVLLPPRDADGLALAIRTLTDSPALRDSLGAAGRERCRTMFDHNRMVDQIERVYRRLLEGLTRASAPAQRG